jgi:hypothetical protein
VRSFSSAFLSSKLTKRRYCSLFKQVVEQAGTEAASNPLGALTAADRDLWTKVRLPPSFFSSSCF